MPPRKGNILAGNMLLRGILTATIKRMRFTLIDCHDEGRTISRKPNMQSVLSIMLNSFQSTSLSIRYTAQQKVDTHSSSCLSHMPFHGMAVVQYIMDHLKFNVFNEKGKSISA